MATWPPWVVSPFSNIPPEHNESDYHGPYNKLLTYLFPLEFFTVYPQYQPPIPGERRTRQSADFIVQLEVRRKNVPVLVVELKVPGNLQLSNAREKANQQIRKRMNDVSGWSWSNLNCLFEALTRPFNAAQCLLPNLWGISAMGTKLRFYWKPSGGLINANEGWDYDVFEAEGEAWLLGIADEIRKHCAALP